MKKVLLPEDVNYRHASVNALFVKTLEDATKMFDFCKENNIKVEWSFAKEDNTSLLGIELKNADMCPYKLMCAKEKEGFDGIIVTIDTDEFEEIKPLINLEK